MEKFAKKSLAKNLLTYYSAELHENKETYIVYYARNPDTQVMTRFRVKLNHIKNTGERRKTAKVLIAEINKNLAQGWSPFVAQNTPKGMTEIGEVIQTWIKLKTKELRKDTMKSYRSFANVFVQYLHTKSATFFAMNVTKSVCSEFMDYLYVKKEISARTYNGYLSYAGTVGNWMKINQYLPENPFFGIKKKREQEKKRVIIPAEARNMLREYLLVNDKFLLVYFLLMFHSLLRPKELFQIKIKDLHLYKQIIGVPEHVSKNHKFRIATIPDSMMDVISEINYERYDQEMYVFSDNMMPGYSMKETKYAGRRWEKLRPILDFPQEYQMYSLRDSGIIKLLQDGISPEEVAKQADHSSLEITSIYALHANKSASMQIMKKATKF